MWVCEGGYYMQCASHASAAEDTRVDIDVVDEVQHRTFRLCNQCSTVAFTMWMRYTRTQVEDKCDCCAHAAPPQLVMSTQTMHSC